MSSFKDINLLVVLGSGGHTSEMCKILDQLLRTKQGKEYYKQISFLVAKSDNTSISKMTNTINKINLNESQQFQFVQMPRSREVGQSYLTSIFTTIWALIWSFYTLYCIKPNMILCNGPGSCVPICLAAYALRLLGRLSRNSKIVFVESACRTRNLSLSGSLLLRFVDVFVVQWPKLYANYKHNKHVKYFGYLM